MLFAIHAKMGHLQSAVHSPIPQQCNVLYVVIMELLRHHGFRAEQPSEYGEIFVLPPAIQPVVVAPTESAPQLENSLVGEIADVA